MLNLMENIDTIRGIKYFGSAMVIEQNEKNKTVYVSFVSYEEMNEQKIWARPAIPISHKLQSGDEVLIAGDEKKGFYIIGILNLKENRQSENEKIMLQSGSFAEIINKSEEEKLRFISKEGKLIFEYNSLSGKSHLYITDGDLEISTNTGSIELNSAKDIRLMSNQSIEIIGKKNISIVNTGSKTQFPNSITLDDGVEIKANEVGICSPKGRFAVEETQFVGKELSAEIKYLKLFTERLETLSCTIIEKTKNIYSYVDGLTQLYTERMRTMVKSTWHCKSQKAFLKTDEDFKIKGEKIHLG